MKGPDVAELQTKLNGQGAGIAVTSVYDAATGKALRNFQKSVGLMDDGICGPLTWGALDVKSGEPSAPLAGTDLHAGIKQPDATALTKIRSELNPTSTGPTGTPQKWDGEGTDSTAAANRAALIKDLTAALEAHLNARMPGIKKAAAARKMPLTAFEGGGIQAKRLTDAMFGEATAAAALTGPQEAQRKTFAFKAGVNLKDASDPAVRKPDAADTASWMAETDATASKVQADHHFDKSRPAERAFLDTNILNPFVAAHKADLELYDQFGFAISSDGLVQVQTAVVGNAKFPDTAAVPGVPSPAERHKLWAEWEIMVHEYIHTLEHPAFVEARKGRRIMFEGFCEMFTKEVLEKAIPIAKADSDPALRGGVEGRDASGALFPGFDKDLVPDYSPGDYASYLKHAEAIRDATSENAVRAAFFQGHVEHIGLTPTGDMAAAPVPGTEDLVTVPKPDVQTPFALSIMTGVAESDILAANPGLVSGGKLPAQVHCPGVCFHTVVEAVQRHPVTGAVVGRATETRAQIAKQHGLTENDLDRANPRRNWKALKPGMKILVPAH